MLAQLIWGFVMSFANAVLAVMSMSLGVACMSSVRALVVMAGLLNSGLACCGSSLT